MTAALDLLYPRRCPICDRPAPFGREICPECLERLPLITTRRCEKCGKPVEETERLCEDCKKTAHRYDEGIGLLRYDAVMRKTMSRLKYHGRKEYGIALGHLAYDAAAYRLARWQTEALIPIPVHPKRRKKRGYNQAEEIARGISERSGIPVNTELLIRVKETRALKELTPCERRCALADAFAVRADQPMPQRLLLVDDIYTTGSTIDAAAEALKRAGVVRIFFLTLCTGQGFMVQY